MFLKLIFTDPLDNFTEMVLDVIGDSVEIGSAFDSESKSDAVVFHLQRQSNNSHSGETTATASANSSRFNVSNPVGNITLSNNANFGSEVFQNFTFN